MHMTPLRSLLVGLARSAWCVACAWSLPIRGRARATRHACYVGMACGLGTELALWVVSLVGFWVGLRTWDFPTERALPLGPPLSPRADERVMRKTIGIFWR